MPANILGVLMCYFHLSRQILFYMKVMSFSLLCYQQYIDLVSMTFWKWHYLNVIMCVIGVEAYLSILHLISSTV